MPHFQGGINLEREDLGAVIHELEKFVVEVEKLSRKKVTYTGVLKRASNLLNRLCKLKDEDFLDVFIG